MDNYTKFFGHVKDILDPRDYIQIFTIYDVYNFMKDNTYISQPAIFDILSHVTLPASQAPYNQGQLSSSVANCLAFLYVFDEFKHKSIMSFMPSRLFLYYNVRHNDDKNTDSGCQLRDALFSINRYGLCEEKMYGYDINKFNYKPPSECYTQASKSKRINFRHVCQTVDQLQKALSSGYPIVFGFTVYESFYSETVQKCGIMKMPTEEENIVGYHTVVAIGYDDNLSVFKIRNSYGTEWGDNGYFYMPYDFIINSNNAFDFWIIDTTTTNNNIIIEHPPDSLNPNNINLYKKDLNYNSIEVLNSPINEVPPVIQHPLTEKLTDVLITVPSNTIEVNNTPITDNNIVMPMIAPVVIPIDQSNESVIVPVNIPVIVSTYNSDVDQALPSNQMFVIESISQPNVEDSTLKSIIAVTVEQPIIEPTVIAVEQSTIQPTVVAIEESTVEPNDVALEESIIQPTVVVVAVEQPIEPTVVEQLIESTVVAVEQSIIEPTVVEEPIQSTVVVAESTVEPTVIAVEEPIEQMIVTTEEPIIQPTVVGVEKSTIEPSDIFIEEFVSETNIDPLTIPDEIPVEDTIIEPNIIYHEEFIIEPILISLEMPVEQPVIPIDVPVTEPVVEPIISNEKALLESTNSQEVTLEIINDIDEPYIIHIVKPNEEFINGNVVLNEEQSIAFHHEIINSHSPKKHTITPIVIPTKQSPSSFDSITASNSSYEVSTISHAEVQPIEIPNKCLNPHCKCNPCTCRICKCRSPDKPELTLPPKKKKSFMSHFCMCNSSS